MKPDVLAAKEKSMVDLQEQFHKKVKNVTTDASEISYVPTASYRLPCLFVLFTLFRRFQGFRFKTDIKCRHSNILIEFRHVYFSEL